MPIGEAGCSAVWQRIWFGTRGSQVQILPSRDFAGVAQLVEQLICNHQVVGSIPITSLF